MHPQLPVWFETGSLIVLCAILAADLLLVVKRPHIPSMKECAAWIGFYAGLALVFALLMGIFAGATHATEFVAGWLTEYSLSLDNLFVFLLIMAQFKVPRRYQQEVLMVGIVIALVLRGAFILLGASLIENFSWVFYIFGAYLVYVGIQQLRPHDPHGETKENLMVRVARRIIPLSDEYAGNDLRTTIDGKRVFTPMILVFLAIGSTDLLFALDSIPAIFGLTRSPFIVFTANLFALMGLRQLYFLLGGLLERLVYLNYGLAAILGFIGIKLVLHALHENELPFVNGGEHVAWAPDIPTWASLLVIVVSMGLATGASILKNPNAFSRTARSDAGKD